MAQLLAPTRVGLLLISATAGLRLRGIQISEPLRTIAFEPGLMHGPAGGFTSIRLSISFQSSSKLPAFTLLGVFNGFQAYFPGAHTPILQDTEPPRPVPAPPLSNRLGACFPTQHFSRCQRFTTSFSHLIDLESRPCRGLAIRSLGAFTPT